MTKSELIGELAAKRNISNVTAEKIVSAFFDSITETLAKGERVEIRGFGTFTTKKYDSYDGRNPKTGEVIKVPAKTLPVFKMGKELRDSLKEKK